MAISDGMRIHDEGVVRLYRMPDLLTADQMKMYFAATYGIGIDFRDLTDDEREAATTGVGIVQDVPTISTKDAELALLRKQLGIEDIEERLSIRREADRDVRDPIVELDSRTMSSTDFAAKYDQSDE